MASRVETLRSYLQALSPESRAVLADCILRQTQGGAEFPGADLIMRELQPGLASPHVPFPGASPEQLFFHPIEPFLADPEPAIPLPGQVSRASLEPIWRWICRDLIPGRAKSFVARVTADPVPLPASALALAVRLFQEEVAGALAARLSQVVTDERARSRLAGQVGTSRAVQELRLLLQVIQHQETIGQVAASLPARVEHLAGPRLESVLAVVEASSRSNPALLPFVLLLVYRRLRAPWQMIRLAVRASEGDLAAHVAAGSLRAAVDLVFARAHSDVARVRSLLKAGQPGAAIAPLREVHGAIRALRTEMDLTPESVWGRELAGLRKETSALLESELEAVPGRVRRLLRQRDAREAERHPAFDTRDIVEVAGSVELLCACRHFAGEVALNQTAPRLHNELQHYVEGAASRLIDGMRAVSPQERNLRQPQIDALVVIAGRLFGAEYGALLAKAATIASNAPRALASA